MSATDKLDDRRKANPFGLAVKLLLSIAAVAAVAVAVSSNYYPLTAQTSDLSRGESVFRKHCAACHSLQPQAAVRMGPNLATIGETAKKRRPGLTAEEYILESIIDPGAFRASTATGVMPQNVATLFGRDEIRSLVAFLSSQGAAPNYHKIVALDVQPVKSERTDDREVHLGRIEAGKDIYRAKGKCIDCHPLDGSPGCDLLAPSLLTAGHHNKAYLKQSLSDPNHTITPGYETASIVLKDGQTLSGRLLQQSADRITLLTKGKFGEMRPLVVARSDLETADDGQPALIVSNVSSMPPLGTSLSQDEVDLLVEFLHSMQRYDR